MTLTTAAPLEGLVPHAETTFEVEDPATTEVVAHVPDLDASSATAAVSSAAAALPAWRALAPRARSEVLRRAYELVVRDTSRLAALLMLENGKPEADARAEVTYAAEFFRWYAEEAVRPGGSWGEAPGRRQPRRSSPTSPSASPRWSHRGTSPPR